MPTMICLEPVFQSTPPCGGDAGPAVRTAFNYDFNPRPLAGATSKGDLESVMQIFQSTPPCGGDISLFAVSSSSSPFQSTPPCGGDHRLRKPGRRGPDFNPRPLAGATTYDDLIDSYEKISIHAPLRGRHECHHVLSRTYQFQSTPPCGGDYIRDCLSF